MRYLLDTDHISFLQRRSGLEFTALAARIAHHSPTDFALSIVSFHEQVLGAHNFINRAQTNRDLIRGYNLLSETLAGFSEAPVLHFAPAAISIFDELRFSCERLRQRKKYASPQWISELHRSHFRET